MSEQKQVGKPPVDPEAKQRRAFIKKVSLAGANAPAVMLLLSANSKGASAKTNYAVPTCVGGCERCVCQGCGSP